jgi:hypothetical protein
MHSVRSSSAAFVGLASAILSIAGTYYFFVQSAMAQPVAPTGEFALAIAQLHDKDLCETVVYNVASGESWYRVGVAWNKIAEPVPLPRSRYEVKLVPSNHDGYRTFRLDKATGQTWYIQELKWIPFGPLGEG